MGRKHVFEGKLKVYPIDGDIMLIPSDRQLPLQMAQVLKNAGLDEEYVRITVEILETSGGATKEAVQREPQT